MAKGKHRDQNKRKAAAKELNQQEEIKVEELDKLVETMANGDNSDKPVDATEDQTGKSITEQAETVVENIVEKANLDKQEEIDKLEKAKQLEEEEDGTETGVEDDDEWLYKRFFDEYEEVMDLRKSIDPAQHEKQSQLSRVLLEIFSSENYVEDVAKLEETFKGNKVYSAGAVLRHYTNTSTGEPQLPIYFKFICVMLNTIIRGDNIKTTFNVKELMESLPDDTIKANVAMYIQSAEDAQG